MNSASGTSVYKCCVLFFFLVVVYSFLGYIPMDGIAKLFDNFMFNFLSNCQTLFPCLHHFTFFQAMHKYTNFSTFSEMFVICHLCGVDRLMLHIKDFHLLVSEACTYNLTSPHQAKETSQAQAQETEMGK